MNVTIAVLPLIIILPWYVILHLFMKEKSNIIANFETRIDFENHIASVHEGKKADIEDQIRKSRKVNDARKSLDFS